MKIKPEQLLNSTELRIIFMSINFQTTYWNLKKEEKTN